MSTQPGGPPPDKTKTLVTTDYKTAALYNAAVTALEDIGYVYDHKVRNPFGDGEWVVFSGYGGK